MMTPEEIASVCHEANRALCTAFGDFSHKSWDNAPQWQRESQILGVEFCLANPKSPPSANHDSWLEHKTKEGWTYGPVKDVENKKHPCMVPFDDLPPDQRAKDHVFRSIVAAMSNLC